MFDLATIKAMNAAVVNGEVAAREAVVPFDPEPKWHGANDPADYTNEWLAFLRRHEEWLVRTATSERS